MSERFYGEAVAPLLPAGLRHTACLIGPGSEVLGYDDSQSRDHAWGPRLLLFLDPQDLKRAPRLDALLGERLPFTFMGYPTAFGGADAATGSSDAMMEDCARPIAHGVQIEPLHAFARRLLGLDVDLPWSVCDWLAAPWARLRCVIAGRVFRDDLGLRALRERLAWYPRDVWLFQIASLWQRIGQEEHLLGRTLMREDHIGAGLLGARLVRDVVWLAHLLERVYPPYPKWLGRSFRDLVAATALEVPLARAVADPCAVPDLLELLAGHQNAWGARQGLPTLPDTALRPFHDRPYLVVGGARFADAIRSEIRDEALRAAPLVGGVDVWSDNTDVLVRPTLARAAMAALLTPGL